GQPLWALLLCAKRWPIPDVGKADTGPRRVAPTRTGPPITSPGAGAVSPTAAGRTGVRSFTPFARLVLQIPKGIAISFASQDTSGVLSLCSRRGPSDPALQDVRSQGPKHASVPVPLLSGMPPAIRLDGRPRGQLHARSGRRCSRRDRQRV